MPPIQKTGKDEIRNMGSPLWIMLTGRGLLILYQILKFNSPRQQIFV